MNMIPVCPDCGSAKVRVDAHAIWNVSEQSWELVEELPNTAAYCHFCGDLKGTVTRVSLDEMGAGFDMEKLQIGDLVVERETTDLWVCMGHYLEQIGPFCHRRYIFGRAGRLPRKDKNVTISDTEQFFNMFNKARLWGWEQIRPIAP